VDPAPGLCLYFCLANIEQLNTIKSALVLKYLNDITLGDGADSVLKECIMQLEEAALLVGLEINKDNYVGVRLSVILTPQGHD